MKLHYALYVLAVVALTTFSSGCNQGEGAGNTSDLKTGGAMATQQSIDQNPAIPAAAKEQIKRETEKARAATAASIPAALRNKPAK